MKRLLKSLIVFSLTACVLTGCTNKRVKILYTVYPIGYILDRLCANTQQYQSVQKDNSIVQLSTVSDDFTDLLESGKVLFHIGDLEPYYATNSQTIKDSGIQEIDLSSKNTVYDFKRYTKKETEDGIVYEQTPFYEGKVFDSVDKYEKDLCLWMDPITMLSMATQIKDYLVANDIANAKTVEENYKVLEEDLVNIDAQYLALSTSLEKNGDVIRFVSMSSCFTSWQKNYGFVIDPVVLSRYGSLPNEEQLQAIEKKIKEDGMKYISYEPNMSEDMIELYKRVKEDCQLSKIDLSNLSSLSDEEYNAGKDYISISYQNLQNLKSIIEKSEQE